MYRPTAVEAIEEGSEESSKYYWLNVVCRNCNYKGSLAFIKGDTVSVHACPNCAVTSLERSSPSL